MLIFPEKQWNNIHMMKHTMRHTPSRGQSVLATEYIVGHTTGIISTTGH